MSEPIQEIANGESQPSSRSVMGMIYPDALPIFFHESVLEEVLDFSERDTTRELGGFLLGVVSEEDPKFVDVRHFLPAADARSRAASLTFTHETWATLTRQVEERFPDEIVVGWHHTHPGFGIFLSGYDLFIHRNYFSAQWHIAMVVDPQRHEFGFFQWRNGEVVDCGFVCVFGEEGRVSDEE